MTTRSESQTQSSNRGSRSGRSERRRRSPALWMTILILTFGLRQSYMRQDQKPEGDAT